MPGLQVSPTVSNTPPSSKLVWLVLDGDGPLTTGQLRAKTALSHSSLRSALDRLEEVGVIDTRPAEDARSRVYALAEG